MVLPGMEKKRHRGEAGWVPLRRAHVKFHPEKQNKELLTVMKNRASDLFC